MDWSVAKLAIEIYFIDKTKRLETLSSSARVWKRAPAASEFYSPAKLHHFLNPI